MLRIDSDLKYEGFFCGIKHTIITLSDNRINYINCILTLLEALRYLDGLTKTNKINSILQHVEAMSPLTFVGDKKYDPEIIARAFKCYSILRSLYDRLRQDYELPSISLLKQLTSKLNSALDDTDYLSTIFSNLGNENQINCILLLDEVYVKPTLIYHGGNVFGKAVNKPEMLATTVLSFMLISLLGGPKYLCRVLPVCELNSDF